MCLAGSMGRRTVKFTLPDGSTIRSIAGIVTEEYVRSVLERVQQCEREFGDALVSISLIDDTVPPSYRIDTIMDLETGETMNWQNFSGRTHRPLSEAKQFRTIWSSSNMTWREVSILLGEIRNSIKGYPNAQGS